jgi:RNA recognition motif-containing protein
MTKGVEPVKNLEQLLCGLFYGGLKFVEGYPDGVIVKGSMDPEEKFKRERKMNRKPKINKKIYVANLPLQASEPELRALFSSAGDVMSVKIVKDRQTSQPRGIAFVEMSTQWEARRAVSMLNRKNFMGKDLLVKEARVSRGFRENW